ncbi:hypothetical protein LOAG_10774, partial [Loa loa]
MSTALFWWGCCNRSVNQIKKPLHRSSDETGVTTVQANSVTRTAKTIREDAQSPALSKSQSIPRTSSEKSVEATQPETMKMIHQ